MGIGSSAAEIIQISFEEERMIILGAPEVSSERVVVNVPEMSCNSIEERLCAVKTTQSLGVLAKDSKSRNGGFHEFTEASVLNK